jgi:hypothetical protein
MERFALPDGNWVVIIAIFCASLSLGWFTSRWLAGMFPALGRFGFLLFLGTLTIYFCVITTFMKSVM